MIPSMIAHSCDSLVARELTYRCNYSKKDIDRLTKYIFTEFNDSEVYESEDNNEVQRIWNTYLDCGFLSYKILSHINGANINLVDRNTIYRMIQEMPDKPFYVLPLHDEFACRSNYVNDLRKQYNCILRDLWNSNLLVHILNQFLVNKVEAKVALPNHRVIGDKICKSNYALH